MITVKEMCKQLRDFADWMEKSNPDTICPRSFTYFYRLGNKRGSLVVINHGFAEDKEGAQ
jgi:hypothetical protein